MEPFDSKTQLIAVTMRLTELGSEGGGFFFW